VARVGPPVDRPSASVWCLIAVLCLCLLSARQRLQASPNSAALLAKACHFLWQQQGDDGGWHSTTHGLLQSGQALTPFVTLALLDSPETICVRPPGQVAPALQFIRQHVNATGVLGVADPDVLEYPNYATAYALRVLLRAGEERDAPLRDAMLQYLLQQQFVEHRSITPADLAYGAWGFGERHLPPGHTGHVDLSHTRRVLQALREAGYTQPITYATAQVFLRLVQKHPTETRLQPAREAHRTGTTPYDGGFYFAPSVPDANKAGYTPPTATSPSVWRSYATATCDGVLALLAAGVGPEDARVQAARQWLRAHPALDYPEGIPSDHPGQWQKVLLYYHLAARAVVYQALNWPGDWRQEIGALLAARQRPDGSFANPYGAPNKEDDPLLATALAVEALDHTLRDSAGPPRR